MKGLKKQLHHNDRIILGTNAAFFLIQNPQEKYKKEGANPNPDYELAVKERQEFLDKRDQIEKEELERQLNMSLEERIKEMERLHLIKVEEIKGEMT